MNQQVSELRNVFIGLSKKISSLEEKVNVAIEQSERAKEYGELARDISLRHVQGDLQQMEIKTIRELFSGSSPSLEEMVKTTNNIEVHPNIADIFDQQDVEEEHVTENDGDNGNNDSNGTNEVNIDNVNNEKTDGSSKETSVDN